MRVGVFQHHGVEGPAAIGTWLAGRGHRLDMRRLWAGEPLPRAEDVDALVVMGGPMSANDGDRFPWLAPEKDFIRAAIEAGKPVLGVCLGAQLTANALGARVYRNATKEIGWFPVTRATAPAGTAGDSSFAFPPSAEVFHWHGETFDLPRGARVLASSPATLHQAFIVGKRALGLQFHLEVTEASLGAMADAFGSELVPGPSVQDRAEILRDAEARCRAANSLLDGLLEWWTGNAA